MVVALILAALGIGFLAGIIFLIQGPPFVASKDEDVRKIVAQSKRLNARNIIDIGAGDGKILIACAKAGMNSTGIELNPLLVLRAKKSIRKQKLQKYAKIRWGNFWSANLSNYDVAVLYGITHIMPKLEKKLQREMPKGAHVISNYFVFENLKTVSKHGRIKTFIL